jgi:hypothetical protein
MNTVLERALYEALAMVRDADEDCKRDGLPGQKPNPKASLRQRKRSYDRSG